MKKRKIKPSGHLTEKYGGEPSASPTNKSMMWRQARVCDGTLTQEHRESIKDKVIQGNPFDIRAYVESMQTIELLPTDVHMLPCDVDANTYLMSLRRGK